MNYELAKQLKDAGFLEPIYPKGEWFDAFGEKCGSLRAAVYSPTLEELIEACKPARVLLTEEIEGEWFAFSNTSVKAIGSTPKEAVGRLWLMLNPKK